MAASHSDLSKLPRIVACPRCKAPVEWVEASRFRPFCSERCKMLDFGAWADEEFAIPNETEALSDEDIDAIEKASRGKRL